MTAQSHTRRTVLTTGAAVAGAAAGTVVLAACGDGETESPPTEGGQPSSAAPAGQRVAALNDVPVGGATTVKTPDGQDAIISRRSQNEVAGFSAVCTHQGCAVAPEGAELVCPCHGSRFDAFTGEVKNGPASEPLPAVKVAIERDQIVTA
ncbi:ferredoxin [Prauserella sp. PE36]|uniref:Cytochrome bc1 complex Rieske iron-sulfur subunit n=1 Tax=Prauserella endophytica TaxID=1592324 RepID=A0ABY2RXW6_9PSEU|nr:MULTISPECIES: Rieske (2Fe-2S) protein [Prauserella]PXY23652.1 ferredoxin [Prauserella coralliicola]RBM16711.1 ferredoxin [Prauserella sp. PE36]TKG64856.1 Rieske (2Fe-2S) protein [Prauserella endophytica]